MVFERPKKPGQQKPPSSTAKPNSRPNKIVTTSGSNSGGGGGGKQRPSPWLDADNEPNPDTSASFVEYLRWMREPESDYKDATKLQLLQLAEEQADYTARLKELNKRTELIAGKDNTFLVKCTWRIRVGGHRGPESILLPAFDALGMPYIPSSSLRGVARTQAIREIMAQQNLKWKDAEKAIAPYFGSLEAANDCDKAGKIVFLDAYPLPNQKILTLDIANNIWIWKDNRLDYSPNPNPFFTLKEPTFLIGLRLVSGCQDTKVLEKAKQWLTAGLQAGIGSQVNTGYGSLIRAGKINRQGEFFRVEFALQGQLIHGRQKFTQWNWSDSRQQWQMRGQAEAEVRPVAFKSMLRYWFRAFALGVLETNITQEWEGKLFGAINPNQQLGWVIFNILEGKVTQKEARLSREGKNDKCGEQQGILTFTYSPESPKNQRENIKKLLKNLTWLMFHLGGVGQGARRACYSRKNRQDAPWWRGSTLIPESDDAFWELPETVNEFHSLFQKRLQDFYHALAQLSQKNINSRTLRIAGFVSRENWVEAIDKNCQIVICAGKKEFGKPYALAVLHSEDLKVGDQQNNLDYDSNLCGKVKKGVKPSPVWIADLGDYQVVTVFGATCDPRQQYLQELRTRTTQGNYFQVFD